MKKIYLLLFLLFSGIGFAQVNLSGYAVYRAEITSTMGNATGNGCCCGGLGYLTLNGIGALSAVKPDDNNFWEDRTDSFSRDFTESNLATSLSLYTRRRTRNNGCSITQQKSVTVPVARNQDITYTDWDNGVFAYEVHGSLQVKTYPMIHLMNFQPANNIIGTESSIVIPEISGVLPEYYNWMYHIDGEQQRIRVGFIWIYVDVWRSLPDAYQRKNSLDIKCKDFLPVDAVGKKIWLRASPNGLTVELKYAQSAPHIVSIEDELTSCFDTNDGKIKINFSRPLDPGEILSLDFEGVNETDVTNITNDGVLDGKKLAADNSYTVENLAKGTSTLKLLGWITSQTYMANTYVMDPEHQREFTVGSPTPVDFTIEKVSDIKCFGGNDGVIEVTASGGITTGIYQYSIDNGITWVTFSNGTKHLIGGLPLGKTFVKVRKIKNTNDNVGCVAKNAQGLEKILDKEIGQPASALQLFKITSVDPTFFEAKNGSITASITGGTLIDGNSYNFEWTNSKGDTLAASKSSTAFSGGLFAITLKDVPQDTYYLKITDKNGCILDFNKDIQLKKELTQPEKIEISLLVTKAISCNTENLDALSSAKTNEDGTIEATVKGGIKFIAPNNNGLPYIFIWKKYNTQTQVWDTLKDYKSAIAVDLEQGNYALNVIDANEISQGTFSDTEQLTKVSTEQAIAEPTAMIVDFDKSDVSCFNGENGRAKASIRDGNSNYEYTWYIDNKSIKNNEVTGLKKGTYYVDIKDVDKGCFVRDSILIDGPKAPLKLTYAEKTPPTFAGASDGVIVAVIEGGTSNGGRYNYVWKNSNNEELTATEVISPDKFTIRLEGLPEGIYTLSVTDKNYDEANGQIVNCSKLNDEVELTEPKPLKVTFTRKDISCNSENEFGNAKDNNPSDGKRDESQDGILIAHVTGGVTLKAEDNNGLPYYYTWKKQNENGTWETLAIKDSIAPNLSHGNYAFNVEGRYHVILGTYTNGAWIAKDSIQSMQEPPKLSVSITKGDVFCFGGNDGWAEAKVVGGTLPYTYAWSNDEDLDDPKNTFLKKGKYTLLITDGRGCTAYDEIDIEEPTAPLSIEYKETLNPSFYKATNGKIVVEVKGGTIDADKKYWFEWKNSKGIVQTSVTTSFSNDIYTISLNGVPEETYTLTVRDANYDAATNKATCTVLNSEITLDDPDPLEVSFEVVRSISCNVNNEFGNETDLSPLDGQRDESQDGILVAHVKGGIQLEASKNNELPYYYTWKKLQKDNTWAIWNEQDETAENLSDGTYALNVKDANGIVLGTYVNNILVEEKDAVQDMPEPAKLILTFTKFDVGCSTGDDGWAEAHVSGGTEPYTYEWTNGSDKPKIEGLTTNNYFVKVTDGRGCVVQGSIFVGDPNGIFTTEELKNPTCYRGNDGSIVLNVTGGNLPYTYEWNTGATTKDLTGLVEGNYEVTITCPDCCVYKKRFTLKDPSQIVVDLGKDRTLCSDQVLDLDASISDEKAEYVWSSSNGFTSNEAKVSLTKAGTYHVKVISGFGCIAEDEIVIKTTQTAISSEFLLSSQAYLDEEVILVNTSEPFGESTEWILPKGVTIVEQKEKYITLKFDQTGSYTIGLQQTQGECFAVFNKNITVEKRSTLPGTDATSKFIVDFIVTPNPSNGNFKALVNLENNSAINLRLFSGTGQFTTIQKNDSGKKKYEIDFNTTLGAGMYILVLETEQQTLVKKIIIY